MTIKQVTETRDVDILYEVYIEQVVVWRRVVDIRRPWAERRRAALEQDGISSRLTEAKDPWAEAAAIRGSGVVAGIRPQLQ